MIEKNALIVFALLLIALMTKSVKEVGDVCKQGARPEKEPPSVAVPVQSLDQVLGE